jgi:hypothetical protein
MLPYDWQYPYRAALVETDLKFLTQKIDVAENALRERDKELTTPQTDKERLWIHDALGALRSLRVHFAAQSQIVN